MAAHFRVQIRVFFHPFKIYALLGRTSISEEEFSIDQMAGAPCG